MVRKMVAKRALPMVVAKDEIKCQTKAGRRVTGWYSTWKQYTSGSRQWQEQKPLQKDYMMVHLEGHWTANEEELRGGSNGGTSEGDLEG